MDSYALISPEMLLPLNKWGDRRALFRRAHYALYIIYRKMHVFLRVCVCSEGKITALLLAHSTLRIGTVQMNVRQLIDTNTHTYIHKHIHTYIFTHNEGLYWQSECPLFSLSRKRLQQRSSMLPGEAKGLEKEKPPKKSLKATLITSN